MARKKNRLKVIEMNRGEILEVEIIIPGSGRIQMPKTWISGSKVRVRLIDYPEEFKN